ncbi:MAG: N-6 DNA methylase [Rhodanobacteraceae bacterium]
MARRHAGGPDLVSQIRRCQELLIARSGADEFHETIRLLIAKALCERDSEAPLVTHERAQRTLAAHAERVSRFVEGPPTLSAPADVVDECLRTLAATRLHDAGFEALDAAFEGLTASEFKANKGQYFTPRHVVDFCVDVIAPRDGESGCDPACGSGAFLRACDAFATQRGRRVALHGYEISHRAARVGALMSFLASGDRFLVEQLDSLLTKRAAPKSGGARTIEDSLRKQRRNAFDFIVTNPPFAGDVAAAAYEADYETARGGSPRIERDVLFLERCLSLLAGDGRLAIVLPDNKVAGRKFDALRRWLLDRARIVAVVSLHAYTFKPHTSQKTCVLFLTRARSADARPVLFYRSDRPGKTSSGAPILRAGAVDHDLGEIARDLAREWR